MRQERADEALKVARDFQRANPKLAAGFVLEADILAQQRKFDAAIPLLNKAQSLQAQGIVAVRIHQLQLAAKRPAEADAGLQQWLNAHPNDVAARLYLAESQMARKQNKAAIAQYETALKAQPDNALVLNNLASLYQLEKDPRALATAERAYKVKPDAAAVADTLGWILVEQGQAARAVDLLRKAAADAPTSGEIGYHYAVALAKSGDKAAARKQLETILSSGQAFPQQDQAKALLKQL
jgi:putative PEP-CTERM system TPR-repeat lipoprotein